MSGGYFKYNQYKITEIIESIEEIIERNGRKKTKEELKDEGYRNQNWYKEYPDDLYHIEYQTEILDKFKEGLLLLKQAQIYAQRIDWFLSGDDGDENFLIRLKEDLSKL
ncbi:MAG: hypothetical protein RLZZ94_695 [Bacteroidota bacterium]|jgi:hypothetical protein